MLAGLQIDVSRSAALGWCWRVERHRRLSHRSRWAGWCWLALALSCFPFRLPAAEVDPIEVVKRTTEQIFSEVRSQRAAIDADPAVARSLVSRLLTPHTDLELTARWVLGKHWNRATPEQRKRFTEEFHTLLVRTYATAVTQYSEKELKFFPVSSEGDPDDATVRTQLILDSGPPVDISYRMRRTDDGWKVYDVTVEGVSLVTTYRVSFGEEVRNRGLDGLIERLVEKNRT